MRTIKPAEIPGKIISLIDEADKELVVVCPYNDFEYWETLSVRLQKAIDRGIKITFFVRKDVEYPASLSELNVAVYYIEKLHAKIYLNEKQAVLTSMNLAEAAGPFLIDFGIETENFEEFEEVKSTYLPFLQKTVSGTTYHQKGSCIKERFKNFHGETIKDEDTFTLRPPKRMRFFEAHFQKTFRRHNLIYNKQNDSISCSHFPFHWTNFEYSGMIKISFHLASGFDYKKFRNENINEFNDLFRNHKTYWSYPYDSIRIYGDEAANGINPNDINAQIAYLSWLIKEVTKFLEPKENVLLKTRLFRSANYSVY